MALHCVSGLSSQGKTRYPLRSVRTDYGLGLVVNLADVCNVGFWVKGQRVSLVVLAFCVELCKATCSEGEVKVFLKHQLD